MLISTVCECLVFGICGLWMLCLVCLWFVASSGLGVVCCDLGVCRLVGCC